MNRVGKQRVNGLEMSGIRPDDDPRVGGRPKTRQFLQS